MTDARPARLSLATPSRRAQIPIDLAAICETMSAGTHDPTGGPDPLRREVRHANSLFAPDRQVENARKGDPRRQGKEAPCRDFIEPIECYDCRNDNQPLRDDIDHTE